QPGGNGGPLQGDPGQPAAGGEPEAQEQPRPSHRLEELADWTRPQQAGLREDRLGITTRPGFIFCALQSGAVRCGASRRLAVELVFVRSISTLARRMEAS
ncbi:unnamed protein product, partial [Pylaiella littoralis]